MEFHDISFEFHRGNQSSYKTESDIWARLDRAKREKIFTNFSVAWSFMTLLYKKKIQHKLVVSTFFFLISNQGLSWDFEIAVANH